MTIYSKSDLATRVLRDLGLVGAEETPSAADIQWAEETISSEVASMAVRGIRVWNGNDTSVPVEYLTPLSRRIGLAVGPAFGLFTLAEAAVGIMGIEKELRQMSAKKPTGAVAKTEYF